MYRWRLRLLRNLFRPAVPDQAGPRKIKLSERDLQNLCKRFNDRDAVLIDAVFLLAQAGHPLPTEQLAAKATLLVARLLTLAHTGHGPAAETLASLARNLVAEINQLALENLNSSKVWPVHGTIGRCSSLDIEHSATMKRKSSRP